jgi:hypothetical protein
MCSAQSKGVKHLNFASVLRSACRSFFAPQLRGMGRQYLESTGRSDRTPSFAERLCAARGVAADWQRPHGLGGGPETATLARSRGVRDAP